MNDDFDKTYRDDKLALLYESNKENLVAVNTPFGITKHTKDCAAGRNLGALLMLQLSGHPWKEGQR